MDLQEEVAKESFREDLFYRLNVVTLYLPPLRNRREDVPHLIDFFMNKFNKENSRTLRRLNRDMVTLLTRYPWPGNVRELENTIERAVVLSSNDDFTEDLLPLNIRMFAGQRKAGTTEESLEMLAKRIADQAVTDYDYREGEIHSLVIDAMEGALIERALLRCGGVKTKAADFLGINRNTLNKKVKDLNLSATD